MSAIRARSAIISSLFVAPLIVGACSSGSQSSGIARGPSDSAIEVLIAAPPDSVIQTAWETLRADGITPRSYQRTAGDTANAATMESEWIYVPNVFPSAPLWSLSEPDKYIKMLFWARPFRGGTVLYIEPLYDPVTMPTEPTNWARVRTLPAAHPAWQYVEYTGTQLARRLEQ
ncbi:MAG: hypothetical protein P8125_05825 [Gemmatimonadota bacterium]|jgi:hypothetical protein